MHRTVPEFWAGLADLPEPVRRRAHRSFALLKENPSHPSLRLKKVGDFWVARVPGGYRALAVAEGEDWVWVWIGDHDEYERLINS